VHTLGDALPSSSICRDHGAVARMHCCLAAVLWRCQLCSVVWLCCHQLAHQWVGGSSWFCCVARTRCTLRCCVALVCGVYMGSYVFGAHLLAHGGWSSTLLRPGTLRWAWPTARVFAAHSAAACVSSLSRCAAVVLSMWVHMQRVLRLQGCVPVLVLLCCDVCLLVHHVDTCEGGCDCAGQMQLSQLSRVSHGGPCACAVNAACQTAECCALQSFVPSCHRRSLITAGLRRQQQQAVAVTASACASHYKQQPGMVTV
jgi:hypothetical protein